MTNLNPPPRLWKSEYLTIDLEHILAVCKDDDGDYTVYVSNTDDGFLIRSNRNPEDGESLIQAWQDYRSVRVVGLR